jgi:hypothetical protein
MKFTKNFQAKKHKLLFAACDTAKSGFCKFALLLRGINRKVAVSTAKQKCRSSPAPLPTVPFQAQRSARPARIRPPKNHDSKGIPSGNSLFCLFAIFREIAKKPRFGLYHKLWNFVCALFATRVPLPP